jgi:hypothetical protein
VEFDIEEAENDGTLIQHDRDELLDVGNRRGFLLAGDLVELRYDSFPKFYPPFPPNILCIN